MNRASAVRALLLLAGLSCPAAESPVQRPLAGPALSTMETASVRARLDREWKKLDPPEPRTSIRGLFGLALDAAASGWHPERVERILELATRVQDRDPKSPTFGNLQWYWEEKQIRDRNSVEFCMQKGALIALLYRDGLTPEATRLLDDLIRFAVEGLRRHKVNVAYTNIFLMKIWNLVALGEHTGRGEIADEGRRLLDDWLACTATNGIREYLSPTYYAVNLESLGLLANFSKDPAVRRKAESGLRFLWSDIAANWFEPAGRLGGAHSRDYDYLTGQGGLNRWVARAGWPQPDPDAPAGDLFERLAWWPPPRETLERAGGAAPRFVFQRFGPAPSQWAAHHVGRRISIGSAGENYHNMDKVLAVNFALGGKSPTMFFFMDARNDPYGRNRILETGSGHMKSLHLRPFVTAVQRGAETLTAATMDMSARDIGHPREAATCLQSILTLPAAGEVWFGNRAVKPAAGDSVDLPGGTAFFLRAGDAAAGVRILRAVTPAGGPAPVKLVNDGTDRGAMRLTVVHSPTASTGIVDTVLWVRAAEDLDETGFAAFRRDFAGAAAQARREGPVLEAEAAGREGTLRIRSNPAERKILSVEGFDPGLSASTLSVNGRELGRDILRNALESKP